MKLFWSSRSPFVRKVMIVAHELGVADRIELRRMIVHPAQPNSEVMAFHPLSKIPVLILDDGRTIYDSRVICEYLAEEFGLATLLPAAGPERWTVLCRHAMIDALIETCLLWRGEQTRPEGAQDADVIAACSIRVNAALDTLERDAGPSRQLTLDQVALASALAYLDFRFEGVRWREERPGLSAWFAEFAARPSFTATAFSDVY